MAMHLEAVSAALREKAEPFLADCERVTGPRLHSLYLVGSAATADWREGHSDVNVLIMLREVDLAVIEELAPLGKRYGKKRIAAPLIMDLDYLRTSRDVFPIEFLELKIIHKVVLGEDILSEIPIDPLDLRRQCEREVKSRLVGLRQGYLASLGDQDRLRENLVRFLAGYLSLFRGIIVLLGKEPPVARKETMEMFAASAGLDTRVFKEILDVKEERAKPSLADLRGIFERCYRTTEKLSQVVDELQV